MDFKDSLQRSKFKSLRFMCVGESQLSGWDIYPKRLENILESIYSHPDVRKNLKELTITDWGLSSDEIKDTINN